ncbi:MAG: hypothetical protein ABIP48_31805 [Planctomycetota bacterium]
MSKSQAIFGDVPRTSCPAPRPVGLRVGHRGASGSSRWLAATLPILFVFICSLALPVGLGKSVALAGDDVMERLSILTGPAANDYRFVAPDNPALTDGRSVDVGQWLPQLHQGFRQHVGDQNRWADQHLEDLMRASDQQMRDIKEHSRRMDREVEDMMRVGRERDDQRMRDIEEHSRRMDREVEDMMRVGRERDDQRMRDIEEKSEQIERDLKDMMRVNPYDIPGIHTDGIHSPPVPIAPIHIPQIAPIRTPRIAPIRIAPIHIPRIAPIRPVFP